MGEEPILITKLGELGLLVDHKAYEWYMPLLGFGLVDESKAEFANRFKKLVLAVEDDDDFIRELILDKNWRPTVVGNALAILLRKVNLQPDMVSRIANWNWVAPQLAVGVAILDDGQGERVLVDHLERATIESNPKSILSIYSALKLLRSPVAGEFEKSELFPILMEKDSWDGSVKIAFDYWDRWKEFSAMKIWQD